MKKEKYKGITIMQALHSNIISNNTIISVNKDNEVICYLKYIDGEVLWNNKSKFRLSMLLDDTYEYIIIDRQQVIESLQEIDINDTNINKILDYIDKLVYKIE